MMTTEGKNEALKQIFGNFPDSQYHWIEVKVDRPGSDTVKGFFAVEARPPYCDRGNFLVKPFVHGVGIDHQDGFPRYYFHASSLLSEMAAFLEARNLRLVEINRMELMKTETVIWTTETDEK